MPGSVSPPAGWERATTCGSGWEPGAREHPNPYRSPGTDTPRPGPFTPSPSSTGRVLPPRPMLVKTPSPKIQLRMNPSHAGAAPLGSVAFGDRCPSAIGGGGTGGPAGSSVPKAISNHELTPSPLGGEGGGTGAGRHLDTSAADTWKISRETAEGQNPAVSPQSEAAAAERQHRIA